MYETKQILDILEDCPVIAAVKSQESLDVCCTSDIQVVFILYGDVCTVGDIVKSVKERGRMAFVHMDLIGGLTGREISVDFIKKETLADGIISTKQVQIRRAKELGLYAVQRFFMIDSMAYESVVRNVKALAPDCVEILPGVMPKVIHRLCEEIKMPVVAGGLLSDREDITAALDAGAVSISTTNEKLWFI